jgi:hypothetical protein
MLIAPICAFIGPHRCRRSSVYWLFDPWGSQYQYAHYCQEHGNVVKDREEAIHGERCFLVPIKPITYPVVTGDTT